MDTQRLEPRESTGVSQPLLPWRAHPGPPGHHGTRRHLCGRDMQSPTLPGMPERMLACSPPLCTLSGPQAPPQQVPPCQCSAPADGIPSSALAQALPPQQLPLPRGQRQKCNSPKPPAASDHSPKVCACGCREPQSLQPPWGRGGVTPPPLTVGEGYWTAATHLPTILFVWGRGGGVGQKLRDPRGRGASYSAGKRG